MKGADQSGQVLVWANPSYIQQEGIFRRFGFHPAETWRSSFIQDPDAPGRNTEHTLDALLRILRDRQHRIGLCESELYLSLPEQMLPARSEGELRILIRNGVVHAEDSRRPPDQRKVAEYRRKE